MAKSSQTEFRRILADIRKGVFAPVYLLSGEEPFYLDRIAAALQSKVVSEEEADFNLDIYYGIETDIETVANAARQFPVMAERRLVMLKELQTMQRGRQQIEGLIPYFSKPSQRTVLAVIYKGEAFTSASKIAKAVTEGGGVAFQSPAIRDYELEPIIADLASSAGVRIQPKAASMLAEFVGADLEQLVSQIQKLKLSLPQGNDLVTDDDIERNIGISKEFNNFELVSALANRNYHKCMQIARYFKMNPKSNPLVVTTGMLFRYFSQLLQAQYTADKTESGLMASLGLKNRYQLRDIAPGLRNYRPGSTVRIIRALRDFDAKSKGIGSLQKDTDLFKELIYQIFTL